MFEKDLDIFGSRDAAEQNDFALRGHFFREPLHVALERGAIKRVGFVDVHSGEFLQVSQPIGVSGGDQSTRGGDDENC